ncbi:MAG: GHKL domain-containing protein [Acetobacter sp.]|nr:GHKL domain-containing protein [Bacteroides sp.]MCM1340331.1 GHKL domain-containing protein [Acetobacter sp.]MCM1433022.1 GHKL domain-containing protein [Clostridiales bacterium]
MVTILLYCVIFILEFFISFSFMMNIADFKIKQRNVIITGLLLTAVHFACNFIFNNNFAVNIFIFFAINIIWIMLSYKITVKKAFLICVIITTTSSASEFITLNLMNVLFNQNGLAYRSSEAQLLIGGIMSKAVYFLFLKIFQRFKGLSQKENTKAIPFYMYIYPFSVIVIIVLLFNLINTINATDNQKYQIMMIALLLLISVIATFIMYNNTLKKDIELAEVKQAFDKQQTDKEYYQILEHQNEEMRVFAHDIKNHLSSIKSLSASKQVDEYIDKIQTDLKKYSPAGNTGNKILDLIINKYRVLCEINETNFDTIIKTANLSFIDDNDLSSLINNILSNALEAAEKSEEKKITLSINSVNNFQVLTCTNSCDTPPKSNGDILITTKHNAKLHGYGTKSITRISNKYNGSLDWNYEADKKEFVLSIVFTSSTIN